MGVRQEDILSVARATRTATAVILILAITLLATGCGGVTGNAVRNIEVEQRPITDVVQLYENVPYTVQETRVTGQECIEKQYSELDESRFTITHDEKEWVGTQVPGETNYLRRVARIYNDRDEVDAVYLDKVYYYKGEEIKRSKHPLMFLVEPKSTRTLYVMWDTQYDYYKDIKVEFTTNLEETGVEITTMRMCYNTTEKVNVTEYKKVMTGEVEEIQGYEEVTRVTLQ